MQQPDLQRLRHILDYCVAIENTIARYGESFDAFDADADYQRSISFSLLQIGELSNGLSEEFRSETSGEIPWHAIRGMRNMVAHSYGSMDRETIWKTSKNDIPAVKQFCMRFLSGKTEE